MNPESKIKLDSFKQPKDLKVSAEEITEKVDEFLNDNSKELEVCSLEVAKLYFNSMRDMYNSRMKEYVNELNYISNKLEKYDEILTKKYCFNYYSEIFKNLPESLRKRK